MKDWDVFAPKTFATRHGGAVGASAENRMLDRVGGPGSIRTELRQNGDGSVTMLRTRGGFPEFTTLQAPRVQVSPPGELSALARCVASIFAELSDCYMTSGAYAFGPLGGINNTNPSLTIEPITYKSGAVSGPEAAVLTPLYDRPPPANGEVSKIYNQTAMPGGLNTPKSEMYGTRPSEFSGLMRRCMQARYGSGVTTANMVPEEIGGNVSVGSTFNRTTGILKFGTTYVFVALFSGGGGMYGRYWPLHFPSDCASLLGTDAPRETLALSKAYVDPTEEADLGNFDIAYGLPIAYGWHFSLTTNKAACVVNDLLAYGYDRRMWHKMSLTFSYAAETGVLTCSYSLDESVDGWIVPARAPIWSPAGAETIWYNKRATSPEPTSPQNFPVHAYYAGDDLKVVRWKWEGTTGVYSEAAWLSAVQAADIGASIFGEGDSGYFVDQHWGTKATHGFTIDGALLTSSSNYKTEARTISAQYDGPSYGELQYGYPGQTMRFETGCTFDWWIGLTDNSYNPRTSHTPLLHRDPYTGVDPHTGNHYSSPVLTRSTVSGTSEFFTGAATHISALVIPANDCALTYIGTSQTLHDGLRNLQSYRGGTAINTKVEEYYMIEVRDPITGVFQYYYVAGTWFPAVMQQATPGRGFFRGQSGGVRTNNDSVDPTYNRQITLHRTVTEAVGTADSEIFHPGLLQDKLSQQVQAISSSLYDEARYNSGTLIGETETTGGYPIDITLFVGAS